MNILPAIDLLNGKCVRLYQGDYNRAEVFNNLPGEMAKTWIAQGATHLHLVDLDGAKAGTPVNLPALEQIVTAAKQAEAKIQLQLGGGIRSAASVKQIFDLGIDRAILGTVAVEQPELVAQLCQTYPGRIIVGIDARDGMVATRGWLETSSVKATELASKMAALGAAEIIYTDIHRDGTLSGPNLEALRELANSLTIPVIASGGVSSLQDLLNLLGLEALGVGGAIVGKAIYTGEVNLVDAIRAVGNGRWQDVPPDLGSTSFA
jgi:phosphoribosylformimino-5-aminoimidazole carboxamide ribotide isomerase